MNLDDARAYAEGLDRSDPLAHVREFFDIPDGTLYFDGNSLGPLSHASRRAIQHTTEFEWRERLIRSWNEDWLEMPHRIGDAIAPLIGAAPATVICCDNTSINLYKALSSAVHLAHGRTNMVVDVNNFPTDIYIAQSVCEQHALELRLVAANEILSSIDSNTAVVTATHVDYRSAHLLDVAGITSAAHAHGALVVWDLAHTAGAVPIDLASLDADFAVGCGYKYLNGGPGAPAFLYAAPRIIDSAGHPLSAWWGHAVPFDFEVAYRPAEGIGRFLTGTVGVLSMKSLEAALEAFTDVSMDDVRAKSIGLTTLFVDLWASNLEALGFRLGSPTDPTSRGSHVALGHPNGKRIVDQLAAQNVIADFRPPDLMRLGFAPLYNRYQDVVDLVEHLKLAE